MLVTKGIYMQKKAISIVLLLALLLIGPVMAAPKKTTFTNRVIISAGGSSQGEQMITAGILYVKNAVSIGYIEADSNSPISGSVWTRLSGSVDLNTMLGSFNGKWSVTNERGTFNGSVVGIITVATVSGKFVGQGIGGFDGQKIQGSFEGTVNNYVVTLILQGILTSK